MAGQSLLPDLFVNPEKSADLSVKGIKESIGLRRSVKFWQPHPQRQ